MLRASGGSSHPTMLPGLHTLLTTLQDPQIVTASVLSSIFPLHGGDAPRKNSQCITPLNSFYEVVAVMISTSEEECTDSLSTLDKVL